MYTTYVNNTLPLALAVHKISRHFWAAYVQTCKLKDVDAFIEQLMIQARIKVVRK